MYTFDLASTFGSAMDKAGLTFTVDCPPLPSRVYVDRDMWEKIVLNLVSNAFKYTLAGEIEVALRADAEGSHVTLTVRDTGVGIPADELPHIFERFHRVRGQLGRTQEGTGIGLAMVHELARLHGGTVRARSVAGQGATFTVTIPTGASHLPSESLQPGRDLHVAGAGAEAFLAEALRWLPGAERPGTASVDSLPPDSDARTMAPSERRRVLLADDNSDMRDYVRRLLSDHYRVDAVGDGEAALEAARRRRPDLILTDVMMPRLDGFGLLRAIRADPDLRDVPIILLSARAGEEASVEGLESGADDYLIKPFNARELLARVRANLELSALRREALRVENELRRQAEMARERAESILASISDGFLTLDADWRLNFVNAAATRLLGRKTEDLVGRDFWELYPETLTSASGGQYRRAMTERVSVAFENHSTRLKHWFDTRVYPARDGGLSIYFQDITERKRADEALAESEARYRTLFNAMTEAYIINEIVYDARGEAVDFRAIEANPAFEVHTGMSRDLVIGRLSTEFAPGGDPEFLRFYAEVVRSGKANRWENYARRPRRWLDLRAFPLGGPRFGIVFNDITDRKNTEAARAAAEARLTAAMEIAEVGAFDYDPTTATMTASGSCNAIFGFADARASRPLSEFLERVDPEDATNFRSEMESASREMRGVALEYRVLTQDGGVKWVAMRGAAIDNRVEGPRLVGAVFDITARKSAELRREAAREHTEVLFREMNHRTKNNLAIIASMLRLQSSANRGDPQVKRHLDAAHERIITIAELHASLYQSDILGLIDFAEYLRKLCARLEDGLLSTERRIVFIVETESIMLSADTVIQMGLVVNELVTNAVKHAFDDSTRGAVIKVSASRRDGRLLLSVADNGRGLPEDWSSRGNGLGSRIINSFVKQAGGQIEVARSAGTRFEISIPVEGEAA
jgi:PAS domain S-box-containing protein